MAIPVGNETSALQQTIRHPLDPLNASISGSDVGKSRIKIADRCQKESGSTCFDNRQGENDGGIAENREAGRERDAEDIAALCAQLAIQTREQAQALVDRYAERHWQEECMLQATLDALF